MRQSGTSPLCEAMILETDLGLKWETRVSKRGLLCHLGFLIRAETSETASSAENGGGRD